MIICDTVIHHRLSSPRYDVRFEVVIMANSSSSGMHPIRDGEHQLLGQPSIFAPRHTQEDNSHRSWSDWQLTSICCWEHIIQWRTVRGKQPSTSSELREVKKKSVVPSLYQNMHFGTLHYITGLSANFLLPLEFHSSLFLLGFVLKWKYFQKFRTLKMEKKLNCYFISS